MATPRLTYSQWLDALGETGRTDEYGLAASAWLTAKTNGRPKLSAVKSVNAWLSEHPPPGVGNLNAVLHKLQAAYHGGLLPETAPEPGRAPEPPPVHFQQPYQPAEPQYTDYPLDQQPAMPPIVGPGVPPAVAADDPHGQVSYPDVSGGGVPYPPVDQSLAADTRGQPWVQQPPPQQPAQDPDMPEHPWQVIMLALGRIEVGLAQFHQAMAPLLSLAAMAEAADQALAASQLANPQVSEAQARAMQIAQEQGWTPGPEIPAYQQPAQAADIDWPSVCPLHCREDRCNGGATCGCPGHLPGGIHDRGLPEGAGFAVQQPAQPAAPPDFYGGHVVQPPDFAAMADASDGREDAE